VFWRKLIFLLPEITKLKPVLHLRVSKASSYTVHFSVINIDYRYFEQTWLSYFLAGNLSGT
jgi:hypothetical protein